MIDDDECGISQQFYRRMDADGQRVLCDKGPPPVTDENFGAVAAELERRGLVVTVPAREG